MPVVVDGAQLAAHRALPSNADFVVFSGHKMYAPFGAGALIGHRNAFERGDPFLVGGGAVDLVDLDEVVWTGLPDREEAGSPNVLGAVALATATRELQQIGWPTIAAHDALLARMLRAGLASIPGVRLLGPRLDVETLRSRRSSWTPSRTPSSRLVSARSTRSASATDASAPIPTSRGCSVSANRRVDFRAAARRHDRRSLPGAVRASAGISTTASDIHRLLDAVHAVAVTPAPIEYVSDPVSGDYRPSG